MVLLICSIIFLCSIIFIVYRIFELEKSVEKLKCRIFMLSKLKQDNINYMMYSDYINGLKNKIEITEEDLLCDDFEIVETDEPDNEDLFAI